MTAPEAPNLMYDTIEVERSGAICTLWLNRPAAHNALSSEMVSGLYHSLEKAAQDATVRVVVIAGRGASFCAGGDINEMKAAGSASFDHNLADASKFAETLRRIAELPKPTIARVQGAALGGGLGLAAACDICIAADTAEFATTEVRFGVIPAVISPYVIRALGERQANRFFVTGERFDSRRGSQFGLVHEVATAEMLDLKLSEIISCILKGSPAAQLQAKRLIRAVVYQSLSDELVQDTATRIAEQRAHIDAIEGLSAVLEKRRPSWVPRS